MLSEALNLLTGALWGWHVLGLILLAGCGFSLSSGFYQIRRAGDWLKAAVGGTSAHRAPCAMAGGKDDATRMQAISTALAGSIGTGNIVGVAAAITTGGPGAIFWMWASALLGMMTIYAENYLSARFRQGPGKKPPGPLAYIERAGSLGGTLAWVYALGCCLSSLGMGGMAQTNALCSACKDLGLPPLFTAFGVGALVFFVAKGGLRRAARLAEKLVPGMTALFFAASLGVLWVFRENLPGAVASIFQGAFSLKAGAGGAAGMLIAMKTGVSRGVFTNEAGLGSSAFAYQDLRGHSPEELGRMGIFQVFADTILMCTVTGLCILCSQPPRLEGAALTFYAYRSALGDAGGWAVSLCTGLFALATVIAWSCYGREGLYYLVKGPGRKLYPLAAGMAAFAGCLLPLEAVFQLGDAFNGLMALPNLIALLYFAREVKHSEDFPCGKWPSMGK